MNIQEAINRTLTNAGVYRAESTTRAYRVGLDAFKNYLASENISPTAPLEKLNMTHFIRFQEWLASNKYSKGTMGVYSSAGKFFLDWLTVNGYIEPAHFEMVRYTKSREMINGKREEKLPRFPELDEPDKMREAVRLLKYDTPIQERNIAIIETLISTGCRNNELCQLKIGGFADGFRSAIVTGKGSKERRVFINKRAYEALIHYWKVRLHQSKTDPAFARHDRGVNKQAELKHLTPTTVRDIVEKVAKLAGIENFSPHYFRHAFAIKMLRETGNLALVQDLLGHSTPAATRVYAKIFPKDLEKAHRAIMG